MRLVPRHEISKGTKGGRCAFVQRLNTSLPSPSGVNDRRVTHFACSPRMEEISFAAVSHWPLETRRGGAREMLKGDSFLSLPK